MPCSIFSLHIGITGFSLYIPVLLHHSLLSCNGLRECCSYVSRPKIILRDYIGLYCTFRTRIHTRCMKYCCTVLLLVISIAGSRAQLITVLYGTVPYKFFEYAYCTVLVICITDKFKPHEAYVLVLGLPYSTRTSTVVYSTVNVQYSTVRYCTRI